ncbi:cheC-like family protein [Anoxybacillus sp. B7M1]|jgi:chemotaxis protein CheC|uniref:Chemotaxis protein CheC n=1 Tax=Anoxybacteroides rupiense TaxID=311460 RepID=A0ABT5W3M3_9BACL|nr:MULTISPECIES: chemotaxis protein CheC [Anoxybacillus]ANB58303.1 cheC-like family protein [Anoxybacillus sp. B2M1]ANB64586.1 cheC-like family protein [Anoxybacillus sp. B7M1]KXG10571.1 CheY-P phosphatase CheC [Anoxybacillus sp. P3H1B]MBB3906145.1 chemotaxis protein CheC [Anoxybacillus rupiensis]MBS2771030.1 chemotaxis protein CheC [Anoxybacillus rupiensis]
MSNVNRLNADHMDILREIGNIGAGNAATALSKLLNKKIEMKVPNVQVVSFDEMMDLVGGAEQVVAAVFLRIEGEAPGNMFFVLSLPQAEQFIKQMTGDHQFSFASPQSDLGLSALQELGNILAGSYLSALADFTHLKLYPSVPALTIDMIGAILQYGLLELSRVGDYAIVIDTAVHEEHQPQDSVNGHFFLLPDPDSFTPIFRSLGVELS